jgi:F-box/leucine-rich repeat protein 2/20
VARAAPLLRAIDLSASLLYASALTDVALAALGAHCPALESVDLSSCTRVSEVGVAGLRRACKRLKHLNLAGCSQLAAAAAAPETVVAAGRQDWR